MPKISVEKRIRFLENGKFGFWKTENSVFGKQTYKNPSMKNKYTGGKISMNKKKY